MSLKSRMRTSSFLGGFFDQQNEGFARSRVQKENLLKMKQKQQVERNKTAYEAALEASKVSQSNISSIKAAGGSNTDGTFNAVGAQIIQQQEHKDWSNYSDDTRAQLTARFLKNHKGVTAEGFYGHTGAPAVTDHLDIPSNMTAVQAKTADMFTQENVPEVTPKVPSAPDAPGVPPQEPIVLTTTPTTAGGLQQVKGEFVDNSGTRVIPTFDPSDPRGPFVIRNGQRDFDIRPQESAGDSQERIEGKVVHVLDDDGKIDVTRSFEVRFNKTKQRTEMEVAPGQWIPKPLNTVLADKTRGRGKEAALPEVTFTEKESTQLQYTDTAMSTLDRLAKTSQLRDRGIVTGAKRLYNSFDEFLIANNIKGDNTITLLEVMARHDEDAVAAGLGEQMQLSTDEKNSLTTYFRKGKTGSQDAAYMKGAINALKKLVPLQIVRAMSDNPRPSQKLISAISDIIDGKPIGTELAGSISEFRRTVSQRERSIYNQKYTPDATPRQLRNAGWMFTGKVFKDSNNKFRYSIKHKSGKTTGIPVRINPSADQLEAWLESKR